MAQSPFLVRLDPRRLDQLKAIASAMNLTNAGAIAAFIREKVAAGVIPDTIPGTSIRKTDAGVVISLREGDETTMTVQGAQRLAATIREVVAGTAAPTMVNPGHNFGIQRQGTGLKVALPFGGVTFKDGVAFPPDLAIDLADQIEKAAA
jgi:hypothetical protein